MTLTAELAIADEKSCLGIQQLHIVVSLFRTGVSGIFTVTATTHIGTFDGSFVVTDGYITAMNPDHKSYVSYADGSLNTPLVLEGGACYRV